MTTTRTAAAEAEARLTGTGSAEAAVHASTGWRDLAKKLPQLNQRVNDLRGQL
jgi:hypothetical protein